MKQDLELDFEDLVKTVAANMNLESSLVGTRQASHVDTAVATRANQFREIRSESFQVIPTVTVHTRDGQRTYFGSGFVGDRRRDMESNAIQETTH